jgi:FtsZ-binding cell division protein ZapB
VSTLHGTCDFPHYLEHVTEDHKALIQIPHEKDEYCTSFRPVPHLPTPEDPAETIAQLRAEVTDLRGQVAKLTAQLNETLDLADALRQERRRSDLAVGSVRRQLQPLYGSLQALFGAMDDVASNRQG